MTMKPTTLTCYHWWPLRACACRIGSTAASCENASNLKARPNDQRPSRRWRPGPFPCANSRCGNAGAPAAELLRRCPRTAASRSRSAVVRFAHHRPDLDADRELERAEFEAVGNGGWPSSNVAAMDNGRPEPIARTMAASLVAGYPRRSPTPVTSTTARRPLRGGASRRSSSTSRIAPCTRSAVTSKAVIAA